VARALLAAALPYDHVDTVAEEKLFGDDGARSGVAFGASDGSRLVGVVAAAGRWVKLLAVDAGYRRRGVGSALLSAVRRPRARIFDHPGNYLSPGLDKRYGDGLAFAQHHGFTIVGEVDNLRAPVDGNPLVDTVRSAELDARVVAAGYEIARVDDARRTSVLGWIASVFAPVWAFEVARALDGSRRAVHAVFSAGAPCAFAAADGNNRGLGWFGPAGTDPAHRGRGLGEALLLRCLLDVRGLPDAGVIAWVGPKPFYAKACGAVDDRGFYSLECP
jgi:GNAT superfamily N-acetyltransferase